MKKNWGKLRYFDTLIKKYIEYPIYKISCFFIEVLAYFLKILTCCLKILAFFLKAILYIPGIIIRPIFKSIKDKFLGKPEEQNPILKTFKDFDKLNLKPFTKRLFEDIEQGIKEKEEGREKGAYTISLDAGFGKGKTTFLEMFENVTNPDIKDEEMAKDENQKAPKDESEEKSVDEYLLAIKDRYSIFSLNAWATELYDNPIIAILAEFINFLNLKEENKKASSKLIDILSTISGEVSLLPFIKIGFNLGSIVKFLLSLFSKKKLGEAVIEKFEQRQQLIDQIKKVIEKYEELTGKKLIIIIDELDRVKPDYAVHFLEVIKHFFDIPGICFIFAVNRQQIEATVKQLFGNDLDFAGYYSKFFNREFSLTSAYSEAVKDFIRKEIEDFEITEKENKENKERGEENEPFVVFDESRKDISKWFTFFQLFDISLRDIEGWIKISYSAYADYYEQVLNKERMEKNIEKSKEEILNYIQNEYHIEQNPGSAGEITKHEEIVKGKIESRLARLKNKKLPYPTLKDQYDFYMILFYTTLNIKYKAEFKDVATEGTINQYRKIFSYIDQCPNADSNSGYYLVKTYLILSLLKRADIFRLYAENRTHPFEDVESILGVEISQDLKNRQANDKLWQPINECFHQFAENNVNVVMLYKLIINAQSTLNHSLT